MLQNPYPPSLKKFLTRARKCPCRWHFCALPRNFSLEFHFNGDHCFVQLSTLIVYHGRLDGVSLALLCSTRLVTNGQAIGSHIILEVDLRTIAPNTSSTILCYPETNAIG